MDDLLKRIESAILILSEGHPFRIENLYLGLNSNNLLNVTGASIRNDLESLNRENCLTELAQIKFHFAEISQKSKILRTFLKGKKIKFNLDFDYGMGDIRICSELDGVLNWDYDLK
jgi:hypothetical protein